MKLLNFSLLIFLLSALQAQNATLSRKLEEALVFAEQQLERAVKEVPVDKVPYKTMDDGSWDHRNPSTWASGYFAGCLWYMYEYNGDPIWRDRAKTWTHTVEAQKNNTGMHDIGLMIYNSSGHAYRLTGEEKYRRVCLKGAQSLSTRYNEKVGCIKSWDNKKWQFPVIIDGLSVLELLLWAAENGGEASYKDMSINHTFRTIKDFVREDGGTFHLVDYNPATGELIKKQTVQGYADSSTWSQGQIWGLYGLVMVYRYTHERVFLQAAETLAEYYMQNIPEDFVPYWDFQAPDIPDTPKDVITAAFAASAFLELQSFVEDPQRKKRYLTFAENTLSHLCSPEYLAKGSESNGILLHGCEYYNRGDRDESYIYADYYFIEAALRYLAL